MSDDHFNDSHENENFTRASLLGQLTAKEPLDREQAWRAFRELYAPMIAGFAIRCSARRQDLDDIVQDVMTAFFAGAEEFVYDRKRGRLRGYLKTITVRVAIRRAGKNLRFQGVPLDELPDADLALDALWSDIWEEQLVAEALRIVRLESGDRTAFQLFEQYVLLDRTVDEVAAEFGTKVNNVHQAKSRMTKLLRTEVQRMRTAEM